MTETQTLGHERLLFWRNRRGITQVDLAERLGVTDKTYGDYERGHRRPKKAMLIAIAVEIAIPDDELDLLIIAAREHSLWYVHPACNQLEFELGDRADVGWEEQAWTPTRSSSTGTHDTSGPVGSPTTPSSATETPTDRSYALCKTAA